MRVDPIFILICILGSVICDEKDELRKAIAVPKQRDKTAFGKYAKNVNQEETTNVDFVEERKLRSDSDGEGEPNDDAVVNSIGNLTIAVPDTPNDAGSITNRSNAGEAVSANVNVNLNVNVNGGNANAKANSSSLSIPSKPSRQSTTVNLPMPDLKPGDKKRTGTKNATTYANGICPSIDIRNTVDNFVRIKDCVIIEGFLQIVLIDRSNETSFENLSFPKLREISGYLLLYRVKGLKSLANLFPNLEVIRGQASFTDYSLMVYEMTNLQELGLKNLTEISRGGVRIEKNPTLCYVKTVNWTMIVAEGETVIKDNKNATDCPGCPPCSQGHCWTSKHCQRMTKPKCHPECLGWCSGPKDTDCYVCKHYRHEKRCVPQCPSHLFGYLLTRCITKNKCLTIDSGRQHARLVETRKLLWRPFNGSCIQICPKGFEDHVDDTGTTTCRECSGPCKRILGGETVRNIADAQRYKGIDVIEGGLEFHIPNGHRNIMNELVDSFGSVEEITGYLKVMHSFPITSLGFFKKLRLIRGDIFDNNNATLSILDNPNLSNLFAKDQKIEIPRGRLYFHYNPKLCVSKIEELGRTVGIQNFSKVEVDPDSNGEKVACNIVNINIKVNESGPDFANIVWDAYEPAEGQRLLGYILNYMETENRNINVSDSNFCGNNTWQSVDVDPPAPDQNLTTTVSKRITDLKPYTSYAIYVKTYTSKNDYAYVSPVGQSEIQFFRTQSDIPTPPTNITVIAHSDTELLLSWGPPEFPNGPLTHYLVSGFVRREDSAVIESRNYCSHGLVDEVSGDGIPAFEVTEKFVETTTKSCCKKGEKNEEWKQNAANFEVMCRNDDETILLGPYAPGKKNFCRSITTGDDIHPVVSHGAYETFRFDVTPDKNSTLIGPLTHFSTYTILVVVCGQPLDNGTERCSKIEYVTARTLKREDADDVHNVNVVILNNTTVTVFWEPIDDPNGMTVAYTIEYTNVDVKDAKTTSDCRTAREIREKRNKYHIRGLSPGKYSVRVRSTSLAGDGRFSDKVEFAVQLPDHNSVGIVVGLCVAIFGVAVFFVLCLVYKRRQNRRKQIRLIASVNPDYIETKYVIDEWEVPREEVEILEELGLGNFGMVYRGILNGTKNVAIKTISKTANLREKNEFLNEASVMKNFSTFHIIRLLGVVSIGSPPFVIMELMENGDLKTYLRNIRDTNLVPNLSRICRMAAEIADGMAYLESKKFVHRDLAARNCMVSKDLVCKIGDFGMARDIYETDYYKIGKKGLLPIRWMAPENLSDGVFTSDSDVWSYAVVLYEILTLAEIPYQGYSNEEVLNFVLRKGTVDIPKNCPEVIQKIMERCLKWRPNDRPTFLEIVSELEPFLSQDFCTTSFYHSSEGVEIRNSGVKKVYHNAAPIRFYFGNETARWVKDFEDNVMLLDQTKAGSSRGRIFKNGFQQFGDLSTMEDVSLDR